MNAKLQVEVYYVMTMLCALTLVVVMTVCVELVTQEVDITALVSVHISNILKLYSLVLQILMSV